jgi:hypothetical protein
MAKIQAYRKIKNSFSDAVRKLEVGEFIVIKNDYNEKQSRYTLACKAFPEAKFGIKTQADGKVHLIRKA